MKMINVMRDGRPATAEELQCAVDGKSLPPTNDSAARPETGSYQLYCNLRRQYDLRLAELEQAKADRNKAAMMERRKYLPKLRALQDELRKRYVTPKKTTTQSKPVPTCLTKPELRHILDALSRLSFEARYDIATGTETTTQTVMTKIKAMIIAKV